MNEVMISQESAILARIVGPENPDFTPEVATSILALHFSDADIQRMNDLAAVAREGGLNEYEQAQLHGYLFVGAMVDLMHSKARLSLKKSAANSHGA